jgi:phosphate acetyltransferase/phosphate butyryltransferase
MEENTRSGIFENAPRFLALVENTRGLEPVPAAIVHAVDSVSLTGAVEAAHEGLIVPIFVGPEAKIRAAARANDVDLTKFQLINTEHSAAAAAEAVAMARRGDVQAIMKGSLHTDELMHAVVDDARGLQTARRISHVLAIDIPGYSRLMFVTDAAINIYPTLEDKRDIVQNAIEVAQALGVPVPKVAILSAIETVSTKIKSTVDAAALCKMADRGQITGGVLDGPLAFDDAISEDVAKTKGIVSLVCGNADIMIVPDLESGNILAKQLEYISHATIAGIVVGARVPIILTGRADKTPARLASSAMALLLVRDRERKAILAIR